MKLTVIPIVIGALGTILKGLVMGIRRFINQRTSGYRPGYSIVLDRPEYWGESWRLEEICCYSDSSERPSASAGVKNLQGIIIIIIIIPLKTIYPYMETTWEQNLRQLLYQLDRDTKKLPRKLEQKIWHNHEKDCSVFFWVNIYIFIYLSPYVLFRLHFT